MIFKDQVFAKKTLVCTTRMLVILIDMITFHLNQYSFACLSFLPRDAL